MERMTCIKHSTAITQRCMISHSLVMHFTLATFKSDHVQSILVLRLNRNRFHADTADDDACTG